MDTDETDLQSELVDLTGFDFSRLATLPRTVLVTALERLHRDHEAAVSPWARFESALIDTDPPDTIRPTGPVRERDEHQQS